MTEGTNYLPTLLSWLVNAFFAVAVVVARHTYVRSMQKQDEIEARLRKVEVESVTHGDLLRLEDKFDKLVERLDRILERSR